MNIDDLLHVNHSDALSPPAGKKGIKYKENNQMTRLTSLIVTPFGFPPFTPKIVFVKFLPSIFESL